LWEKLYQQNGKVEVQKYECRLCKSKKNGKAHPPKTIDNGGIKNRHSRTIRDNGQCDVRINSRSISATVTIERMHENTHSYSLERSCGFAQSELAIQIAGHEASKGHAPIQVLKALRGAGKLNGKTHRE
jgi:hypothetical protein